MVMGRLGGAPSAPTLTSLNSGKILRDGRADVELVFLGQDHRGDGGDGLRHGRDAEDGVLLHGRLRGALLIADGVEGSDLAVADDQQHGAGNALGFHIVLQACLAFSRRLEENPASSGRVAIGRAARRLRCRRRCQPAEWVIATCSQTFAWGPV